MWIITNLYSMSDLKIRHVEMGFESKCFEGVGRYLNLATYSGKFPFEKDDLECKILDLALWATNHILEENQTELTKFFVDQNL